MVLDTKAKRPAPNIHQKKRVGAHHQKHNQHYVKTYWPYLPLFGLAGLLVIVLGARILGTPGAVIGSVSVALAGISLLI